MFTAKLQIVVTSYRSSNVHLLYTNVPWVFTVYCMEQTYTSQSKHFRLNNLNPSGHCKICTACCKVKALCVLSHSVFLWCICFSQCIQVDLTEGHIFFPVRYNIMFLQNTTLICSQTQILLLQYFIMGDRFRSILDHLQALFQLKVLLKVKC